MSFHFFINLFQKFNATTRCKMLEVKKNQHLSCGKTRFPQDFHNLAVENYKNKNFTQSVCVCCFADRLLNVCTSFTKRHQNQLIIRAGFDAVNRVLNGI
jgi:hypothetical protein